MVHPGFFLRMARTVSAKTAAPPSFKSSRATAVTTTCFKPMIWAESATRSGSSQSNSFGSPVLTAQKRQPRVHVSPRIINVAVFLSLQHSWMFGQRASSQTVFNFLFRINFFNSLYDLFLFYLIFFISGFLIYSFFFFLCNF